MESSRQRDDHYRLSALGTGLTELASAGSTLEIPPIALRIALAATDSTNGSFWRETTEGWECHLASGPESSELVGRVIPLDAVLDEGDDGMVLVAALAARPGAAPFAALRVWRESDATPFRPAIDREWLTAVAQAGAAAFVADARLRQADRSTDVALLAEMSREIASTLDLDRVLRLAVNLAARAVPFDRGAIALYEHGHCDVRAIAGAESVDPEDPVVRDIAARGEWAAGAGEGFYLSDRDAPGSDAERIFVQIFGEDLAAANAESGLYLPLKDEEGVLGVLVLEAAEPDFASVRQREITDVLAAQVTVAIRNAQLYAQIPLAATIGAFTSRGRALLELPRRRRALAAGIAIVILAALTLIRWPLRVVGDTPMLSALDPVEARALVDGVVERV
ncbi:MAG: GAF domain-containing protein, partial [Gemmatimonadaceae bacterium]